MAAVQEPPGRYWSCRSAPCGLIVTVIQPVEPERHPEPLGDFTHSDNTRGTEVMTVLPVAATAEPTLAPAKPAEIHLLAAVHSVR